MATVTPEKRAALAAAHAASQAAAKLLVNGTQFKWNNSQVSFSGLGSYIPIDTWDLNVSNNNNASLMAKGAQPQNFGDYNMAYPNNFIGDLAVDGINLALNPDLNPVHMPNGWTLFNQMVDVANKADDELVSLINIRNRNKGTSKSSDTGALGYYNGRYAAAKAKVQELLNKFTAEANETKIKRAEAAKQKVVVAPPAKPKTFPKRGLQRPRGRR
jgi:hypothetical protein